MGCYFCGGGDRWIKTCLASDGSRVRVCDPCREALRLVIVPGDASVTARCDLCGGYGNPREFPVLHPGGRKDAYAGMCETCVEEGVGDAVEEEEEKVVREDREGEERS